jgi:hypothetical protein
MKTVADFKRAMILGSLWNSIHVKSGMDTKGRMCKVTNSVGFALTVPENDKLSHCDWPKASDASFSDDGNTVTISKNMAYPNEEPRIVPVLIYTKAI